MNWAQQQRLIFITDTLQREGYVNRYHLINRFGISKPQASNDLAAYMELHPGAMTYDGSEKRYVSTKPTGTTPVDPMYALSRLHEAIMWYGNWRETPRGATFTMPMNELDAPMELAEAALKIKGKP